MEYGMFTVAGNRAVDQMVTRLLKLPISTSPDEFNQALNTEFKKVAEKHGEVWDTDVRDAVISVLERKTRRELSIFF
jgi:hypothetical protein